MKPAQCSGLQAQGNLDEMRTDKFEWLTHNVPRDRCGVAQVVGHNAEDRIAQLLDIAEVEGVEHTQPFTQHPILRIQHYPGRKIIRVQLLGIGMPQEITVGVVIDAVGRSLLDEFKQAMLVHGPFA